MSVAEVIDGALKPFPDASWHDPAGAPESTLFAVLGIQIDAQGILWMLDNAVGFEAPPKLVGWNIASDSLHQVVELGAPVSAPNSFLNDLAVDSATGTVFIADTAFGPNTALIVVDLASGKARRVLEGHASTVPEDIDLVIEGKPVMGLQPDGSTVKPRVGVDSIALDADNSWLYFGALSATTLYRVSTDVLRDPSLDDGALGAAVERFSDKPLSDGISVDADGNVYISDLGHSAIGVIDAQSRAYSILHCDPHLLPWPDGMSYGPDGRLYITTNQLHRLPLLNAGKNEVEPPFLIHSIVPLANGTVGR